MHIDWTINIENILAMIGMFCAATAVIVNLNNRLSKIERWIQQDGERMIRAMQVLDSLGSALTRVATLFEGQKERVDTMERRMDRHHENDKIHLNRGSSSGED